MTHDETLAQLRQEAAEKKSLEAKLQELYKQRSRFEEEVVSLRVSFSKEQSDVEKLNEKSLATFFYQVIGQLDDKQDRERAEALAAKAKLDAAERELEAVGRDITDMQTRVARARTAEYMAAQAVQKKAEELKASGTELGVQILDLEQRIAELENQKREIREAISAGHSARSIADRILAQLDSAKNWNTWDMVGGGGIITHMAKHSHLDEAQNLVSELQSKLRRFKTELADIRISANMQVNIDGFLRFADYFFDGLFADLAVSERIDQSKYSVSSTKSQIERTLDKLGSMEKAADSEIARLKLQLDDLIVKA